MNEEQHKQDINNLQIVCTMMGKELELIKARMLMFEQEFERRK